MADNNRIKLISQLEKSSDITYFVGTNDPDLTAEWKSLNMFAWVPEGNTNGLERYIGTNDSFRFPVAVAGTEYWGFELDGSITREGNLYSLPMTNGNNAGTNTSWGFNAGSAALGNAGTENVFIGTRAGAAQLGDGCIYIGYQAGLISNTDNNGFNVYIGSECAPINANGTGNCYVGYQTGFLSTAGFNTFIGNTCGGGITTGTYNTMIGKGTGGSNNVSYCIALGSEAAPNANNQCIIGSAQAPITDVYIGSDVGTSVGSNLSINGSGTTGSNVAAGHLSIAPGKSTGNATPANLVLKSSMVLGSGTTPQSLGDRIAVIGKWTTLTDATATTFASLNLPSGDVTGGDILLTVVAGNGTDVQSITLLASWSAVNAAGTITGVVGTPILADCTPVGTLTCTITAVDGGSNTLLFKADATSSLTETFLSCNVQLRKNFSLGVFTAV